MKTQILIYILIAYSSLMTGVLYATVNPLVEQLPKWELKEIQ